MRAEILEALLRSKEGSTALLEAIEDGRIGPRELDGQGRERLEKSADPTLRAQAAELLPAASPGARGEVIARYRSALAGLSGDTARGKEVFQKHCSSCHRLDDEGVNVGPDLVGTAAKDQATLLEAILNPSRMVPPRYTPYLVETRNRGLATGLISSETATSITLLRAHGISETILRQDIRKLNAVGESLMPSELEKSISPEQMADLLEFLKRL